MRRTLIVLTLAQSVAMTGAPIVVLLGGIIGTRIAPDAQLATLPMALMIVGTALTTVPAALFMARFGRKAGFLFGAAYASASGLLAAWAIAHEHFWLFCVATFFIGSHNAFIQQYRFAVAESVPLERVGPSLSILMLAGVAAAFIGPEAATRLHDALPFGEYTGSFVGQSVLMAVAFALLLFYPNAGSLDRPVTDEGRPLKEIALQRAFLLATGAAVVGYAVMSFVMTATPVSMHVHDHLSLEDTKWVVQSHIMAMYLPSLVSGSIIARIGSLRTIAAGVVLLLACLAIGAIDHRLIHYWWALVLLGVGWNLTFLGGTTLLTRLYRPSERYKVQALNDFLVFGLQAVASLSSGLILAALGWIGVLGLSVPWLLALVAVMLFARKHVPAAAP